VVDVQQPDEAFEMLRDAVHEVLREFQDIFEEPKGLSP
jgi:hypothetical protein